MFAVVDSGKRDPDHLRDAAAVKHGEASERAASNSRPIAPTTISAPGTSFIMPKVATPTLKAANEMAVV
jgi:hypothetical protein